MWFAPAQAICQYAKSIVITASRQFSYDPNANFKNTHHVSVPFEFIKSVNASAYNVFQDLPEFVLSKSCISMIFCKAEPTLLKASFGKYIDLIAEPFSVVKHHFCFCDTHSAMQYSMAGITSWFSTAAHFRCY